ncbi:hypothetical protein [Azohydromonas aeria]|uniref:hypothetical protein n=1 Tax=Azohydromonas aeria TaxID=2590212 RepID=UPI0012F9C8AD|nr:hypothetical protein [Azohydromonas aeria]
MSPKPATLADEVQMHLALVTDCLDADHDSPAGRSMAYLAQMANQYLDLMRLNGMDPSNDPIKGAVWTFMGKGREVLKAEGTGRVLGEIRSYFGAELYHVDGLGEGYVGAANARAAAERLARQRAMP